MENEILSKTVCRVAVVGAQRMRVAKVVSLLTNNDPENSGTEKAPLLVHREISIEYLPCVAKFGSYENESGDTVKYLASVEYHGSDGKDMKGSSLAPFLDEDDGTTKDEEQDITFGKKLPRFPGISAVAIGSGIESKDDVNQIETFVNTLSGTQSDSNMRRINIECVAPNSGYSSMKEENEAYKAMDAEDKAEAAQQQTIGPGKMAKFASSLAQKAIDAAYADIQKTEPTESVPQEDTPSNELAVEQSGIPKKEEPSSESEIPLAEPPKEIDPEKMRYACRRCRTILFGQDDLENPPHTPSRHNFSMRKVHHAGGNSAQQCQSIFLGSGADWMGDMNAAEGKFGCPKCGTKLGHYSWSGAQCSCGTWVVPAIQVPISKVDLIAPLRHTAPPATYPGPSMASP